MRLALSLRLHAADGVKAGGVKRDWAYLFAYFATALLSLIVLFANILE